MNGAEATPRQNVLAQAARGASFGGKVAVCISLAALGAELLAALRAPGPREIFFEAFRTLSSLFSFLLIACLLGTAIGAVMMGVCAALGSRNESA